MRKLFSFRSSSASDSENDSFDPPYYNVEKVFRENPWKNNAEDGGKNGSEPPKDSTIGSSNSTEKRKDNCPGLGLRRSFSFSGERHSRYLANLNKSLPGYGDAMRYDTENPVCYKSSTPERPSKSKQCDLDAAWKTHAFEIRNSPSSSKDYHSSSGNSPHSSPVPLRCRVAGVKKILNKKKVLDMYIAGEKPEQRLNDKMFPDSDGCLEENKVIANSRRPPRAYSTAPSSPICNKENLGSHPFRDMNNFQHYLSIQNWQENNVRPASPKKHSKVIVQKLANAFGGRSKTNAQEYDSETTTTIDDIYEDTTHTRARLISDDIAQNCHLSDNLYHYKTINGYCLQDSLGSQKEGCFDEDNPGCRKNEKETDKELSMKLKEAKERLQLMSDTDLESEKHKNGNICVSSFLQLIKDINGDRRNLASELVTQIECRIIERSSAKEALEKAATELSTRTRRLEKEKLELQSCLEKELDGRSCDWSLKFETFRAEEQRLRERVRELAEQNVSLQREVSSLSGREADTQNRIANLELQLNDLTAELGAVRKENQNLHLALLELKERCDLTEADRDCIKRSYKMKENENSELHKIVVRFQKMCNENEKTIAGLRQGLNDETAKQPQDRGDLVCTLQLEQLRLTGVERALRREIESCMNEVKKLRHENTCLLDHLRGATGDSGFSLFRLDNELKCRLEYLQNQGLFLLYENIDLCGKLLKLVETQQFKHGKEISVEFDAYSVVEYNMKFHSLKRGIDNLKRSLQVMSVALKEKSQESPGCQSQASHDGLPKQKKDRDSEGHFELELKAEILLTKILRENLLSKEMELERLQGDLASSLRKHEVLRSEIQGLQDELSILTHKAKNMEHQMLKKDESLNQLEQDFKECLKELNVNRNLLPKVSKERDHLWEEVKQLKETNMLFKYEVNSLKKKIEALEEDILIKDGQICILKDSLDTKPYEALFSPDTLKNAL